MIRRTEHGRSSEPAAATPMTAQQRRLFRVTGAAGLATMVLVFVPLIALSGQEPSFNATAAETLTYAQSVNSPLAEFGWFVFTVGMVAFLWFVVGLTTLLRRAEGEPPWRSTIALASGVLLVPLVLTGNSGAAASTTTTRTPSCGAPATTCPPTSTSTRTAAT